MRRTPLAGRLIAWLTAGAVALAGCTPITAPPAPVEQAVQEEQAAQETSPCPDANVAPPAASPSDDATAAAQPDESAIGYERDTVLLIGLARDLLRIANYMSDVGPVRLDLPFSEETQEPPEPGQEQPAWFRIELTGNSDHDPRVAERLFFMPVQEVAYDPDMLVVAKAGIRPARAGAGEEISPGLAVLAVAQVVAVSDRFHAQKLTQIPVFAQLNNTIARPAPGVEFNPNGIGAHPCGPLGVAGGAGPDLFWQQWALGAPPGVNAGVDASPSPSCTDSPDLQDAVPVVVFDSAPFQQPVTATLGVSPYFTATIPLVSPQPAGGGPPCGAGVLTVTVSSHLTAAVGVAATVPSTQSQHGLFAAALVHATWRHADIALARVLEDTGHGDLYTLLLAMETWRKHLVTAGRPGVFNLSLGIDPLNVDLTPEEELLLEQIFASSGVAVPASANYQPLDVDPSPAGAIAPLPQVPAVALETAIRLLTGSGAIAGVTGNSALESSIVMVASAGNKSGPQQFPAAYQAVLGVAALSGHPSPAGKPQLACYSNHGDVAAPGGGSAERVRGTCGPAPTAACATADCPHSVLSIVAPNGSAGDYALAFWSGTSFAAPMVSGLVAQRIAGSAKPRPPGADLLQFVLAVKDNCNAANTTDDASNPVCVAGMDSAPLLP